MGPWPRAPTIIVPTAPHMVNPALTVQHDISKSCGWIVTKLGGWVASVTRTSRFDFSSGPDPDLAYQCNGGSRWSSPGAHEPPLPSALTIITWLSCEMSLDNRQSHVFCFHSEINLSDDTFLCWFCFDPCNSVFSYGSEKKGNIFRIVSFSKAQSNSELLH